MVSKAASSGPAAETAIVVAARVPTPTGVVPVSYQLDGWAARLLSRIEKLRLHRSGRRRRVTPVEHRLAVAHADDLPTRSRWAAARRQGGQLPRLGEQRSQLAPPAARDAPPYPAAGRGRALRRGAAPLLHPLGERVTGLPSRRPAPAPCPRSLRPSPAPGRGPSRRGSRKYEQPGTHLRLPPGLDVAQITPADRPSSAGWRRTRRGFPGQLPAERWWLKSRARGRHPVQPRTASSLRRPLHRGSSTGASSARLRKNFDGLGGQRRCIRLTAVR
jgi:hypothetical protein